MPWRRTRGADDAAGGSRAAGASRAAGGSDAPRRALRLYYASDIHGSETLWRKFLAAARVYHSPVLVMGGDVTGKAVVPLLRRGDAYELELFGRRERVEGEQQLREVERRIGANGMYPHRMDAGELARVQALSEDEREQWFAHVILQTFERWMELAAERLAGTDVRCFVMAGNDDPAGVAETIERASAVHACDERVVRLDGHEMISLGYSNRTPFHSPRELDEDELYDRVDALAAQLDDPSRAIFNLHVPPYDSTLDTAAQLDEQLSVVMLGSEPKLIPVGSTAVRELIERHQPLLSLHGHVHESPGAERIGRTLCVNPGSDYHTGRIAGCLLTLRQDRVVHQFVTG
ncbi:MAG: metallophosphoesterase family protein [Solirubrobacteraceae bacterium]